MPRVTISQIARECGLCHQTVSRILNGKAELHLPETVKAVTDVAEKLGYRPHAGARLMRSETTGNVAMVLDSNRTRSGMPDRLIDGILGGLESHGLGLNIVRCSDQQLNDDEYVPKILKEVSSDGLIANINMALPKRMAALIKKHRVPLVWLNIKRATDCVHPDDYGAARELASRLVARGRKRVAFLCEGFDPSPYQHYSKTDRLAGYRDAMKEAGMQRRELLLAGGLGKHDTIRAYEGMFGGEDSPDAVIAYGKREIHTILMRLPPELGMRIRSSVEFTMFGSETDFLDFPVNGMALQADEEGASAVAMLLEKMASPKTAIPTRPIPYVYRDISEH